MRSAIIAAIVGVVAAVPLTETVYNTKVYTITSCGAEVTDCPGKKTPVPVTTTCTDGHKESYTAPPVYLSTSTPVVQPPVVYTSSAPAPPPYVPSSKWEEKPSTSEAAKTSSAPAPPKYTEAPKPSTTSAPAPPPYTEAPKPSTSVVVVPSSKVTSKPAVGTSYGTASTGTGLVPYKTTSASWSATSTPAKYTGAASHLNAAGAIVGAGAFAALFL